MPYYETKSGMYIMKVSVIIPSLNPDNKLVAVVDALLEEGFQDIIIVNDGSDENHMEPFRTIAEHKECTILTHEVNKGKGRGLKTAFEFCLSHRTDIDGVVTVDGDNQHRAKDIRTCSETMVRTGNVVLGVRNFSGKDVPARSRFGNNMTSGVFKIFCGLDISDTQTGLRAIPFKYLEVFDKVDGERFEYETNMLLALKKYKIGFEEEPIETVYIDDNSSSHFNPIKDSLKIYKVIFKYIFKSTGMKYVGSSIASWVIDNGIFNVLEFLLIGMAVSTRILISTAVARVMSSIFNFTLNRNAVFKSESGLGRTIVRYYILWFCQLLCSYGLVYLATKTMALGVVMSGVAKIIIDLVLFLISYQIQKRWVFK